MVKHWFLIFLGIGEAQSNLDVLGTRLVSEQLDGMIFPFWDGVTVLLNLVLSHAAATVQVQVFQVLLLNVFSVVTSLIHNLIQCMGIWAE